MFFLSLAILVLDQITKYLIKTHVGPHDVIRVLPFFDVVYVENVGSAFGLFRSLGNIFFVAVAGAAIVVLVVLIIRGAEGRLGLSLILGGAAGNLVDRLVQGSVIDFLSLHAGRFYWPAFNVADSALTIGIGLLFVNALFGAKEPTKEGTR